MNPHASITSGDIAGQDPDDSKYVTRRDTANPIDDGGLLRTFKRAAELIPKALPRGLRDYQADAVTKLIQSLARGERPVGAAPTGSGKTWLIAALLDICLKADCTFKAAVLARDETLVEQNHAAFVGIAPLASVGIYCAGLGRKDSQVNILFATAQSLARKLDLITPKHLVIVDECDQLGKSTKQLQAIVARAGAFCGLTATPYRLEGGRTASIFEMEANGNAAL